MLAARLSVSGLLLLLAPRCLALRALTQGAERRGLPEPGGALAFAGPGGEADQSFLRTNRTRVRTLQQLKEVIANKIRQVPLPQAPKSFQIAGMEVSSSCRMSTSACGLSDLKPGVSTSIYPGGRTTCLLGAEFSFQVFPGASDKLYIHLGGGGACWDEVTTLGMTACVPEPFRMGLMGFFNKCGGPNPLDGFTVVYVPACAGDLHVGNVTRPWTQPDGRPIMAKGYVNMRAVIDWVRATMDPQLSRFVLTGDSAGSIGAQMWAAPLLRELRPKQARILGDSYAGVLPPHFQEWLFQDLQTCDSFFKESPGSLWEKCNGGNLTIIDVYNTTMQEFPDAIFGNTNSKHDATQRAFYDLARLTQRVDKVAEWCGDTDPNECDLSGAPEDWTSYLEPLSEDEYHRRAGEIFESYSNNPNYVSYFLSGSAHSMGQFVFGCHLEDLPHDPSSFWLGEDGKQQFEVAEFGFNFFSPERVQHSGCQMLEGNSDDYCNDKQSKKTVV